MTRWISSALCTAAFVAVLFCLPVWNIRSASPASTAPNMAAQVMSAVHVVKRTPKKAPPVVRKHTAVPKTAPRIPEANTSVPKPKPEAVPVESDTSTTETAAPPESAAENAPDEAAARGSGSSAESSFSSTQDEQAVTTYKSYALGRIASKKRYPYKARIHGFTGRVRVRIVINPDGTLAQMDILEPSEHKILNDACLAAIKKAAPFKKMASGMTALTLSFIMDFSLN